MWNGVPSTSRWARPHPVPLAGAQLAPVALGQVIDELGRTTGYRQNAGAGHDIVEGTG